MRVLVTGGAGFIGSAVCRHFVLDLDYEVIVVDKLTYAGNLSSLAAIDGHPKYSIEKSDICDAIKMRDVFLKHQPDAVVHLAAESHVDRSISGSDIFVQTNVVGTFTLLEAARAYLQADKARASDFDSFTSPPTRSTARWEKPACSKKPHRTIRVHPIRRQKLPPII